LAGPQVSNRNQGPKDKDSSETEMTIVIVSTKADRRCTRKLNFPHVGRDAGRTFLPRKCLKSG